MKSAPNIIKEPYPKLYIYRRIVQAKQFIDEHYAEKIDLSNIAEEAFFSKFHFIRLFKRAYDKTPHQYLNFVRIGKAKELMKAGGSIAEACYTVGFESATSFTGLFKRITSQTPSMYRQQHQSRQAEMLQVPLKFIPGCFAASAKSNYEEVTVRRDFHLCNSI